jgi:hypothetical protein
MRVTEQISVSRPSDYSLVRMHFLVDIRMLPTGPHLRTDRAFAKDPVLASSKAAIFIQNISAVIFDQNTGFLRAPDDSLASVPGSLHGDRRPN